MCDYDYFLIDGICVFIECTTPNRIDCLYDENYTIYSNEFELIYGKCNKCNSNNASCFSLNLCECTHCNSRKEIRKWKM